MSHIDMTSSTLSNRITRYWVVGFPTILLAVFLMGLVSLPLWIPVGFAIAWKEWLWARNLQYLAAFVFAAIQLIYLPTALGWLACEVMPKIFGQANTASRIGARIGEQADAADSR
jgi:hypothetical protein